MITINQAQVKLKALKKIRDDLAKYQYDLSVLYSAAAAVDGIDIAISRMSSILNTLKEKEMRK